MRHDPGLVVGHAARVQAPVALDRLERIVLVPQGEVPGGLDVLVRVQQHRRLPLGGGEVGQDARLAVGGADLPHRRGPRLGEEPLHLVGASADRLVVEPVEGDPGDADQVLQVGAHSGHGGAHRIHDIVHEGQ